MKKQLNEKNKKAKKRIIIESFIVFFIIISPFVFKLHEYVSTDPEATLSFLGIKIGNNGFLNVSVYIWFLLGKIVPMYLLLIWFFTCKDWWYHIITIPILMYAFQIFESVFFESKYVDIENIMWLLPVCMVVIPFVYFIRIKLYDKHVHGIDLEAMDAELKAYREKEKLSGNKPYPFESTGSKTTIVDNPNDQATSNSTKSDNFLELFQGKLEKLFDIKL